MALLLMPGDAKRRLDELARRAQQLDDLIQRAAEIQKQVIEEIKNIGRPDALVRQPRLTRSDRRRKRAEPAVSKKRRRKD